MKSRELLLIVLFSFFYVGLRAQIFVGGNVGFNTSNNEMNNGTTTTAKSSGYEFDLSPNAGKFISEKFAIGIELNISLSGSKSGTVTEIKSKSSSIGVSPFLRYYAIKWNKFSVYGQGNVGLNFSKSSTETGGRTTDGPKTTLSYLNISPGLSYDISEKISLETSLDFLSLGYYFSTTKQGTTDQKGSGLSIGAGLGNIVSINAITIGAIFKF
jgi:outer membrane protein